MRTLIVLLIVAAVWMSGFVTHMAFAGDVLVSDNRFHDYRYQARPVLIKQGPAMPDILEPEDEHDAWYGSFHENDGDIVGTPYGAARVKKHARSVITSYKVM